MDIKPYLKRIKYIGELTLSLEVLSNLQKAHLMTVPFENLDIHNKIKIDLYNSYDKIISHGRGGFCYELNGTFYQLLKYFGYKVKMVSARAYNGSKMDYGPEFDHMAIIATICDVNYLVDVGFGEFAFQPIPIYLDKDFDDPRGIFRIEKYSKNYLVVMKKNPPGDFLPEYIFSNLERQLEEFNNMCNYHQASNESHFTQKRLCSLPTNEGRMTLTGTTFKVTTHGIIAERQLENEVEVQQVLLDYFKI